MNSRRGMVWLVGAGPGDPGLITIKGAVVISRADVIIYDALCNPSLLDDARPDAELLYAGKQAGKHSMKQDEINELIYQKAAEGKQVCRLKGGDPFVFGRGGEEALYLEERGIPFEIVPGVTSAVAAPAYAGIPVTHRQIATSVRFITGHEDPTKPESQLDWQEIAATNGTLVFLMGVTNTPLIAERLIAFGRSPGTPAALISNGTLPTQRTCWATLGTIVERMTADGIQPPAIFVVGDVVALGPKLQWFENKPLFGSTIVVTRARAQMSELAQSLRGLGADVIEAPTIRIESMGGTPAMRAAAREVGAYDWVVFTSANGVDAFMESLNLEHMDSRAFARTKIAAIGPGTAEALGYRGLFVDLIPERFVAEALLEAFDKTESFKGQRYLVPRSEIARPELVNGLRARGAEVSEVHAYRTLQEAALPEGVLERLAKDEIDLVTFTSSSTVRNFVEALPAGRRAKLLARVKAASIGPVTSDTLNEMRIEIAVTAGKSTIMGLIEAVVDYVIEKANTVGGE